MGLKRNEEDRMEHEESNGTIEKRPLATPIKTLALGGIGLLLIVGSFTAAGPQRVVSSGLLVFLLPGGLLGVLGIVCGVKTLRNKSGKLVIAILGLVFSVAGVAAAGALLWVLVLFPGEPPGTLACGNNLKNIGLALEFYAMESDGVPPERLRDVGGVYIDEENLRCPTVPAVPEGKEVGYFYYPPDALPASDPNRLMACDWKGNHPRGRNCLFADGSARWLKAKEFTAALDHPCNAPFAAALMEAEAGGIAGQ